MKRALRRYHYGRLKHLRKKDGDIGLGICPKNWWGYMQTQHACVVVGCAVILVGNLKQLPVKNTLQILNFWKAVWNLMFLAHCHIIDWAKWNGNTD